MTAAPPDCTGQVAIVTGAGRGIGLATAERLHAGGAIVVVTDIVEPTEAVLAECLPDAERRTFVALDVTDAVAVAAAVDDVNVRFGSVDILVNVAGIAGPSVPTWELTDVDWTAVLAVNLSGAFYCTRAVLPGMRSRRYGRIVNVASIAGKEGNPNAVPYSSSKAGLIGLTKAVAKEVCHDGILVNCVTPAVIETNLLAQMSAAHIEYMVSRIPLGRIGQPAEVAELIAWLASERCTFSTGAVFDISGGRATY